MRRAIWARSSVFAFAVNTVKGYADFEKETLTGVIHHRRVTGEVVDMHKTGCARGKDAYTVQLAIDADLQHDPVGVAGAGDQRVPVGEGKARNRGVCAQVNTSNGSCASWPGPNDARKLGAIDASECDLICDADTVN